MAKAPTKAPAKKAAAKKSSRKAKPNIVAGTGASATGLLGRPRAGPSKSEEIEAAMSRAATEASKEGVQDGKEIHKRMMKARAQILGE